MQKAREYRGEKNSNRSLLISLLITGDCTLKTVCLNRLPTLQSAGNAHLSCQASGTNTCHLHQLIALLRCRDYLWNNSKLHFGNLISVATFRASKSLQLRTCVIVMRWANCPFVHQEKKKSLKKGMKTMNTVPVFLSLLRSCSLSVGLYWSYFVLRHRR